MKIILVLLSILVYGCNKYPAGVEQSLNLASNNKNELIKVLEYFKNDSLKYEAACFLIDNMKWHYSTQKRTPLDSSIYHYYDIIDYLYFDYADSLSTETLKTRLYSDFQNQYLAVTRKMVNSFPKKEKKIEQGIFHDIENINSDFLIGHIENAFNIWENSKFAKDLNFEYFKEYILPYRSISGYFNFDNGKKINSILGKHLIREDITCPWDMFFRLFHYYACMNKTLSLRPHLNFNDGIYNIMIIDLGDCINIANHGCNILRAIGLPTALEYNLSHKLTPGRHFHCAFLDSTNTWIRFNAFHPSKIEIENTSINLYRNTFGAQEDSPYFLKNKDERIPQEFYDPCMMDITSEVLETVELTLPLNFKTENNLAYLYTFSKNEQGVIPTTWGIISEDKKSVTFKNATYNSLYVGGILKEGSTHYFTEPFYLTKTDTLTNEFKINYVISKEDNEGTQTMLLHRKYPVKPSLVESVHSGLIGTKIEAANNKDFSDAKTILHIKETLVPYLQEFEIPVKKSFRYYKLVLPERLTPFYLLNLELLVKENDYTKDFPPASPLPILKPEDIGNLNNEVYYNIPDPKDERNHYALWPYTQLLELEKPLTVEKIRLRPLIAENNIKPEHTYRLMYWDNGWQFFAEKTSSYHFIEFENVPKNKLYWLLNLTEGKEELPFTYEDGEQQFIYHQIIN